MEEFDYNKKIPKNPYDDIVREKKNSQMSVEHDKESNRNECELKEDSIPKEAIKESNHSVTPKKNFMSKTMATFLGSTLAVILIIAVIYKFSGYTLIKSEDAKRLKDIGEKYNKLAEVENLIESNSIYNGNLPKDDVFLVEKLVESLGDKYADYLTPAELQNLQASLSGNFSGVGLIIRADENGQIVVERVVEKSPAENGGLEKGDIIIEVDGEPISELKNAVSRLKGKVGTKVNLLVQRGNEKKELSLIRANIKETTVASSKLDDELGYIRISSFDIGTSNEFKKELGKLEKTNAKGFVLDLRSNVGGVVSESINIADMLLPEGNITTVIDAKGKQKKYNSLPQSTKMKFVVLVNRYSASSSEILAGALKDNKIPLIGETTYGKGVIQSIYRFSDGSGLKLTTSRYLTPSGFDLQSKGVEPNYSVEGADEQLTKAREVLQELVG